MAPTRDLLADVGAVSASDALTARRDHSYALGAILLRARRSHRVAELAYCEEKVRAADPDRPSGLVDDLDDEQKTRLRIMLRRAVVSQVNRCIPIRIVRFATATSRRISPRPILRRGCRDDRRVRGHLARDGREGDQG
jgi:hypothetical protein